jgi:hypothetical protein
MTRCLDPEPLDQQSCRLISPWRQGARHPGKRSLDRPVLPWRFQHGAPDAPRDQGASRARRAAGPPPSPLNRTTRTPAAKSPIRLSASSGNAHIKMFWSQHSPVAPSAEAVRNRRYARTLVSVNRSARNCMLAAESLMAVRSAFAALCVKTRSAACVARLTCELVPSRDAEHRAGAETSTTENEMSQNSGIFR